MDYPAYFWDHLEAAVAAPPPVTDPPLQYTEEITTDMLHGHAALSGKCLASDPIDLSVWFPVGNLTYGQNCVVTMWASDMSYIGRSKLPKQGVFLARSDDAVRIRASATLSRTWNAMACPFSFSCPSVPDLSVEILSMYCLPADASRASTFVPTARGIVRKTSETVFELAFARTRVSGVRLSWYLSLRFGHTDTVEFCIPSCPTDLTRAHMRREPPPPSPRDGTIRLASNLLPEDTLRVDTLTEAPSDHVLLCTAGPYSIYVLSFVQRRSGRMYHSTVSRCGVTGLAGIVIRKNESPDAYTGAKLCIVAPHMDTVALSVQSWTSRHDVTGYMKPVSPTRWVMAMPPESEMVLHIQSELTGEAWAGNVCAFSENLAEIRVDVHVMLPPLVMIQDSPVRHLVPVRVQFPVSALSGNLECMVGNVPSPAAVTIAATTRLANDDDATEIVFCFPSCRDMAVSLGVHDVAISIGCPTILFTCTGTLSVIPPPS